MEHHTVWRRFEVAVGHHQRWLWLQELNHQRRILPTLCPPGSIYRQQHLLRLGTERVGLDDRHRAHWFRLSCLRRQQRSYQLHPSWRQPMVLQHGCVPIRERGNVQHHRTQPRLARPDQGSAYHRYLDILLAVYQLDKRHVRVSVREVWQVQQWPIQL